MSFLNKLFGGTQASGATAMNAAEAKTMIDSANPPYLLDVREAYEYRDGHIHEPAGYDDFKQIVADGWAFAWWCGRAECEASIKEETRATTRCIPLNQPEQSGDCIYCGRPAKQRVYFARAY